MSLALEGLVGDLGPSDDETGVVRANNCRVNRDEEVTCLSCTERSLIEGCWSLEGVYSVGWETKRSLPVRGIRAVQVERLCWL